MKYKIDVDMQISDEDMDTLVKSVNPVRLVNFPLQMSADEIREMYAEI